MKQRGYGRQAEFIALYFGVPGMMRLIQVEALAHGWAFRMPVIPILLVTAAAVLFVLWRDPTFDRSVLTAWRVPPNLARSILLRFLFSAVLLAGLLALIHPSWILSLPRANPLLWAIVVIAYPILSVYPQGILYRAFYLHRYAACFPERLSLLIGAAAFSFTHIVFGNVYALLFTFIGGLLFLDTYRRSHSLLLSGLEHALYGDFLFTLGWGAYFYGGTIQLVSP